MYVERPGGAGSQERHSSRCMWRLTTLMMMRRHGIAYNRHCMVHETAAPTHAWWELLFVICDVVRKHAVHTRTIDDTTM
jgi:hypothetical protein